MKQRILQEKTPRNLQRCFLESLAQTKLYIVRMRLREAWQVKNENQKTLQEYSELNRNLRNQAVLEGTSQNGEVLGNTLNIQIRLQKDQTLGIGLLLPEGKGYSRLVLRKLKQNPVFFSSIYFIFIKILVYLSTFHTS